MRTECGLAFGVRAGRGRPIYGMELNSTCRNNDFWSDHEKRKSPKKPTCFFRDLRVQWGRRDGSGKRSGKGIFTRCKWTADAGGFAGSLVALCMKRQSRTG